jgi:hypothetical protein
MKVRIVCLFLFHLAALGASPSPPLVGRVIRFLYVGFPSTANVGDTVLYQLAVRLFAERGARESLAVTVEGHTPHLGCRWIGVTLRPQYDGVILGGGSILGLPSIFNCTISACARLGVPVFMWGSGWNADGAHGEGGGDSWIALKLGSKPPPPPLVLRGELVRSLRDGTWEPPPTLQAAVSTTMRATVYGGPRGPLTAAVWSAIHAHTTQTITDDNCSNKLNNTSTSTNTANGDVSDNALDELGDAGLLAATLWEGTEGAGEAGGVDTEGVLETLCFDEDQPAAQVQDDLEEGPLDERAVLARARPYKYTYVHYHQTHSTNTHPPQHQSRPDSRREEDHYLCRGRPIIVLNLGWHNRSEYDHLYGDADQTRWRLHGGREGEKSFRSIMSSLVVSLLAQHYAVVIYALALEDLSIAFRVFHESRSFLLGKAQRRRYGSLARWLLILPQVPDAMVAVAMLKGAVAAVSYRLHGSVLSAAAHTPFISLAYQWKHLDFAHSVGTDSCQIVCIDDAQDAEAAERGGGSRMILAALARLQNGGGGVHGPTSDISCKDCILDTDAQGIDTKRCVPCSFGTVSRRIARRVQVAKTAYYRHIDAMLKELGEKGGRAL